MINRADLHRRINALDKAINPANFTGAKLANLTADQRAQYDDWRDRCSSYYAANPGGSAYERSLSGEQPPPLRSDVRDALFGPTITIPANATDHEAADIYSLMLDR